MFKLKTSPSSIDIIKNMSDVYAEANPFRYQDPPKYLKIVNDFYNKEINRRLKLLQIVQSDKTNIYQTLQHISKREHIIDWIVDWCWTYDPRLTTVGLPTMIPMIPFPRQVDFVQWVYDRYLKQERGIGEKSRDAGATWFCCTIATFEWRWTEGFAGAFGSNKLDNVDQRDNPDCIFEKIRTLIKLAPPFWMPEGYNPNKHDKVGTFYNPEMGSYIQGQGGKEIGRGGRRSIYFVDEAAALEFPMMVDASLSANTNCQLEISTPRGMNHFGQKRHSGNIPVFTFHWKDDPRKDNEWFEIQKKTLNPVVLAQEILIDYHASVEGLFIKPEWVQAAIDLDLKPTNDTGAGLDVAAGGSNKSSLAIRFGPVVTVQAFNYDNGTDLTHAAIDLCNKSSVNYLNYDLIGVGFAVKSTINRTEKSINFLHYGIDAGESPSDMFYPEFNKPAKEVFVNARAEWWYLMARRFEKTYEHVTGIRKYPESEMISIPNNGELISQLSSPKRIPTETGKIKCESKTQMLSRGVKSPDEADAVIMAFIPKAAGRKHIVGDMSNSFHNKRINWKLPDFKTRSYGALVINKDTSLHGMCAIYDEEKNELYIHSEIIVDNLDPEVVAAEFITKMELHKYTVDRIIGNDKMFKDLKKSFQKELNTIFWNKLNKFQTVMLKPARRYDPIGSLSVLLNMVKHKNIIISKNCNEIYNQFMSWKLEKGKVEYAGMCEAVLLIISELMTYEPFKKKIMKVPEYRKITAQQPPTSKGDPLAV